MSDTLSLPPKPTSPSKQPAHVQAYAKLEGDDVCYYMKELHITIGRKINPQDDINVDLGPTKAISRQHAKIYYNLVDQKFELSVQGKNGVVIDDVFYKKGSNIKLEHGSKIQIGNQTFYFLLPKIPSENQQTDSSEKTSFSPNSSDPQVKNENPPLHPANWTQSAPRPKLIPIAAKPPISTSLVHSPAAPGLPASLPARSSAYREIRAARPQRPLYPAIPQVVPPSTPSSRKPFTITHTSSEVLKDAPHIKPPYSYASMIAQAINSVPEKKMTLNNIYNYIATKYPYYKLSENGWQNSIRHNLSLNKSFTKVPRLQSEPGKGSFWTITSNSLVEYGDGVYKRRRPSSASSSARAASNSPYAPDQKTARHAAFYSNPNAVAQPHASHSLHHLPPRLLSTSFPPSSDVNQVLPPLNFGKFPPLTTPPSTIPTSIPAPSDTFGPMSSDLPGNVSQTLSKLSLKSSLPSSTSRVKVQDLVHANPSSTTNVETPPNPPSSSS